MSAARKITTRGEVPTFSKVAQELIAALRQIEPDAPKRSRGASVAADRRVGGIHPSGEPYRARRAGAYHPRAVARVGRPRERRLLPSRET